MKLFRVLARRVIARAAVFDPSNFGGDDVAIRRKPQWPLAGKPAVTADMLGCLKLTRPVIPPIYSALEKPF
jgi:hypothetical protein